MSGGEQQMLSIGRALMGNPTLLLLDEPLEGLAPVIIDVVLKAIERLKREDDLGILLVEQHARIALEHTEKTIVLDRGRIVHYGESEPLRAAPEQLATLMGVARPPHGHDRTLGSKSPLPPMPRTGGDLLQPAVKVRSRRNPAGSTVYSLPRNIMMPTNTNTAIGGSRMA